MDPGFDGLSHRRSRTIFRTKRVVSQNREAVGRPVEGVTSRLTNTVLWHSVAGGDQCRLARRSEADTSVASVEWGLVITYNPASNATTVGDSRVVLAQYLRIDTRPTARRDEDESPCSVHRERINPTILNVAK